MIRTTPARKRERRATGIDAWRQVICCFFRTAGAGQITSAWSAIFTGSSNLLDLISMEKNPRTCIQTINREWRIRSWSQFVFQITQR